MGLELTDDEAIVLDLHPHWTTLLRSILLLILAVAVTGAVIFFIPDGDLRTELSLGAAALGLVVVLVTSLVPFLRWFTTRYVLTSHRLIIRTGILSRSGRDVPLSRVNDAQFSHNLIQRILGTGTLTVESGGENGQLVLKNIPDVERVQHEMYGLINGPARP
ncbi:MAG: PH domain-containing protein [Streptosporangiaceae bacterium]